MDNILSKRARLIRNRTTKSGPVIYWMSRDQRVLDNWALIFAYHIAKEKRQNLIVIFTLAPSFPTANLRHYDFMLKGLAKVQRELAKIGINFVLLQGEPHIELSNYIKLNNVSVLVSDFDPLKIKQFWKNQINSQINIPHYEVDAHNIVPCWEASNKLEFGAYTLRPKIKRLLPQFLIDFPKIDDSPIAFNPIDWDNVIEWLNPNKEVKPINWIKSGENEAHLALKDFITNRLEGYSTKRNDPNENGQSNLSPYLHFGQISAQRIAMEVIKSTAPEEDKAAFLEELIIRKELSDNFCFYNSNYDSTNGFHEWSKATHQIHRVDKRDWVYKPIDFEHGKTHDLLWNAAQLEMEITGKMHGFMRMYWAKKILEWTQSPENAMIIAIYLNDKYSLDGRDPNGYTGIAWSIGGVHDRAWTERSVFGKIRYMNYNGCKRKFDVIAYIKRVSELK